MKSNNGRSDKNKIIFPNKMIFRAGVIKNKMISKREDYSSKAEIIFKNETIPCDKKENILLAGKMIPPVRANVRGRSFVRIVSPGATDIRCHTIVFVVTKGAPDHTPIYVTRIAEEWRVQRLITRIICVEFPFASLVLLL